MTDAYALSLWILMLIGFRILSYFTSNGSFKGHEGIWSLLLAILLSSYIYWLWGSLFRLPNGSWFSFVVVGLAWGTLWLLGKNRPRVHVDWTSDLVFWVTLFSAIGVRAFAPEIDFGEKYADLMVFQSVLLDDKFPPKDRWLSGYSLNYYYFSHLLFVPIVKILRIAPEWAFNLITSTVAALITSASYSALRWCGVNRIFSLFSSIATILVSNWEWLSKSLGLNPERKLFWWWDSSRVIPNTITEFPFFSFLLGDLHAHYISMPWMTLTLVLVFLIHKNWEEEKWTKKTILLTLCAISVGAHYPLNPWQIPFMALLTAVFLRKKLRVVSFLGLLSFILFLPFWLQYERPTSTSSLFWVSKELRSPVFEFSLHWAPFLLSIILFISLHLKSKSLARKWKQLLIFLALTILFSWKVGLSFSLLFVLVSFGYLTEKISLKTWDGILLMLAAFLIGFCEFFSVDQTYGKRFLRINTVFKFYSIAWWALALSIPALYSRFWKDFSQRKKITAFVSIVFILSLSLVYPVRGTIVRIGHKHWYEPTLDGMAKWHHEFSGEREMIQWIRSNTHPTDVIWELHGPGLYKYARVSTFSGRPTILGWIHHEHVWRKKGYALGKERKKEIESLYEAPSKSNLKNFLSKYNVKWIVLGKIEKKKYPPKLQKLIQSHPLAFKNARCELYRVSGNTFNQLLTIRAVSRPLLTKP